MGYPTYSTESRLYRSVAKGYDSAPRDEIFQQNKERKIHESMNPKDVIVRECRDSENHPDATPIQLYLDVTGSMGSIPHMLIKDGLPTLMTTLIQNGVKDAALMFGAVGDHECDRAPLQIGQFESGDAELDMWLTRTWLEGGGGPNEGESYSLAWYFAANHVVTDAWEKRKKKGYLFTIGDEPVLEQIPKSAIVEIMGSSAKATGTVSASELLSAAELTNHVFHIHLNHGGRRLSDKWKQLLGDRLIVINNYLDIPKVIADLVIKIQNANSSKTVDFVENSQSKPVQVTADLDEPHAILL